MVSKNTADSAGRWKTENPAMVATMRVRRGPGACPHHDSRPRSPRVRLGAKRAAIRDNMGEQGFRWRPALQYSPGIEHICSHFREREADTLQPRDRLEQGYRPATDWRGQPSSADDDLRSPAIFKSYFPHSATADCFQCGVGSTSQHAVMW